MKELQQQRRNMFEKTYKRYNGLKYKLKHPNNYIEPIDIGFLSIFKKLFKGSRIPHLKVINDTIDNCVFIKGENLLHLKDLLEAKGLYVYNIRHSDSNQQRPATIEHSVSVNLFGSIVTKKSLDFGDDYYIPIKTFKNML